MITELAQTPPTGAAAVATEADRILAHQREYVLRRGTALYANEAPDPTLLLATQLRALRLTLEQFIPAPIVVHNPTPETTTVSDTAQDRHPDRSPMFGAVAMTHDEINAMAKLVGARADQPWGPADVLAAYRAGARVVREKVDDLCRRAESRRIEVVATSQLSDSLGGLGTVQ